MTSALLVPMHVDCLWVNSERNVESAFVDFTALPWSTPERDINPDTPYLSEAILNPPFQDRQFTLRSGLHLHWSLPAALSRKFHGQAGVQSNQWARAPNRWLVSRFRDDNLEQEWIVESDYLHPVGMGLDAIVYPVTADTGQQPYRHLGRRLKLQDWEGNNSKIEALERLTAIGYGEPAFASWYPASHSVFGFHDAGVDQAQHSQLRYDVLGWYHDPAQDPLADIADIDELAERLHWILPSNEQNSPLPERSICFARCSMQASKNLNNTPETQVAIARTGSEALSALLAEELSNDSNQQARLEDQLESLVLAPQLEHRKLDIGAKFREARHEKGFVAMPGGQRWAVRPERNVGGASPHGNEPRLPAPIAHLLERANHAQQSHDDALHKLDALRSQLYADWCKYQHCRFPPSDSHESYPDADEVRDFIEQVDLAPLSQWQSLVDGLQIATDSQGRLVDARVDPTIDPGQQSSSTAFQLAATLRPLIHALELFSKTGFSGQISGTRLIATDTPGNPASSATPDFALDFDGRSNWLAPDHCIDTPAPVYKQRASVPALTVSVWLRSQLGGTIASWDAKAYWAWSVNKSGHVVFSSTGGDDSYHDLTSQSTIADGHWHHLAIRYSAGESRKSIWIDGKLDISAEAHARWPLGNGQLRHGSIGATVLPADDEKPSVSEGFFTGQLAQFRLLDVALTEQQMLDMPAAQSVAGVALRPIPAPRYWQPREPVVLIKGPLAKHRAIRQPAGNVDCMVSRNPALASFDTAGGQNFSGIAEVLRAEIDAIKVNANGEQTGIATSDGERFEALQLEWQAEVWPLRQGFHEYNLDGHYSPDYITTSHQFNSNHVDLEAIPGSGGIDRAAGVFSGRCVLSNHAAVGLREHLEALLADPTAKTRYPELVKALAHLHSDEGHVLSQALSGFNAALLQRHQVLQLPVGDPFAFTDVQPFTHAVAEAVGKGGSHGALPKNAFMPITSGAMKLLRLRLLDRFGRTQEIDLDRIASPRIDQLAGNNDLLRMPPRISQAARIELRWLAADNGLDEMNGHVNSNPVCGWLLPNNLDDRVAVFNAKLQPLGRLGPDARGNWHPAIGADQAVSPSAVGNPYLQQLMRWLLRQSSSFFQSTGTHGGFRELLEKAQEIIHPANASQHNGLSLLTGSPVAIVRLRLSLSLRGEPAVNQDWNVLRRNLKHGRHDHSGFTAVNFPVLLGASNQFNDGLLGFWLEENGALGEQYTPAVGANPISLQPNGPPVTVTALIDPRCALHVTSGVLPVKAIDLPQEYYSSALENIGAGFLTSPLLTDSGKLNLPLRDQPGFQWSWLERSSHGHGWQTTPRDNLGPISRDARFSGPQEIREGWLQLSPINEDDST